MVSAEPSMRVVKCKSGIHSPFCSSEGLWSMKQFSPWKELLSILQENHARHQRAGSRRSHASGGRTVKPCSPVQKNGIHLCLETLLLQFSLLLASGKRIWQ